jgi:methylthioribose-1-phosphate isomerase
VAGTSNKDDTVSYINKQLDYLMGSRPTAVDLSNAIKMLKKNVGDKSASLTSADQDSAESVRISYIEAAEKILEDDLTTNRAIGRYGAEYLRRQYVFVCSCEAHNL